MALVHVSPLEFRCLQMEKLEVTLDIRDTSLLVHFGNPFRLSLSLSYIIDNPFAWQVTNVVNHIPLELGLGLDLLNLSLTLRALYFD